MTLLGDIGRVMSEYAASPEGRQTLGIAFGNPSDVQAQVNADNQYYDSLKAQKALQQVMSSMGSGITDEQISLAAQVDPNLALKLYNMRVEQAQAALPQLDVKFNPQTGEQLWLDKRTGMPISGAVMGGGVPMQGGQGLPPELQGANPAVYQAYMEAQATAAGKNAGERNATKAADISNAQNAIDLIETLKTHPGLSGSVGAKGASSLFGWKDAPISGTDEADFTVMLDQLKGGVFLQAYQTLKGGGQITEVEGKKAEAALARLDRSQTEEQFKKSLSDFQSVLNKGIQRLGGEEYAPVTVPDTIDTLAPDEIDFLKSQGLL